MDIRLNALEIERAAKCKLSIGGYKTKVKNLILNKSAAGDLPR